MEDILRASQQFMDSGPRTSGWLLAVFIVDGPTTLLHELGHAVAARRRLDGDVRVEVGFEPRPWRFSLCGIDSPCRRGFWSARGLQPHRVKTFKLSNDKRFEEKLVDVVGLYLNPPENAIVLCMDEKSQIQALDRTQPSLPIKKGRAGTTTHDYKRNGATTLFAALDVLTGSVVGQCLPRHRHSEFLKFLRTIDREVPAGLEVHLILETTPRTPTPR